MRSSAPAALSGPAALSAPAALAAPAGPPPTAPSAFSRRSEGRIERFDRFSYAGRSLNVHLALLSLETREIDRRSSLDAHHRQPGTAVADDLAAALQPHRDDGRAEIGRASCRER